MIGIKPHPIMRTKLLHKFTRYQEKLLRSWWQIVVNFHRIIFPLYRHLHRPPSPPSNNQSWKILYASPVGKNGKYYLAKIIHRFGYEQFKYLIFVYDHTHFDEPVFKGCQFIREKGIVCYFYKKYLTPDVCKNYDYIFAWVDDLDIRNFSVINFMKIFQRNELDLAQPALSYFSLYSHQLTRQHNFTIGRFTDFVELMAMVFTSQAWIKYWQLLEQDWGFWGWGYNHLLKSFCNLHKLGIIDSETITHLKKSSWNTSAHEEKLRLFKMYNNYERCLLKTEGELQ